jgi:TPR repeat protein
VRLHALALLAAACSTYADVRIPSVRAAPMEIAQPGQAPIESNPISNASIPTVTPSVPRIEPPPLQRSRPLNPPPATPAGPLVPRDPGAKAIQDELLQLRRTASPNNGYGSSVSAAQAAWQLGLIHLHGAGVRVDRPQAQQWFERSALQGREPWAFAGLAWCAIDGCSGPPAPATATQSINRLRAEHPERADYLAWLQASRLKPLQIDVSSNSSAAPERQLLERAAERGDVQANLELGIMAYASNESANAERYFGRIASRSSIAAENLLQVRSQKKSTSPKSRAASTDDSAEFALDMARMYHRGEGVPANYSEALRFYRLAEQRGSAEAHRMIELIFSGPRGILDPVWMQQLARADLSRPASMIAAGITSHQLQREVSPLSDLLAPRWKARLQQVTQ